MLVQHHAELDEEGRKKISDRVTQQVARARDIMDKFLTLGRIYSGAMAFQPSPVQVATLLKKWGSLNWGMDPAVDTMAVSVKTYGNPGVRSLDETLVTHVVFNLVANAIKFSPPGAGVFVLVCAEESGLKIQVRDNGRGIPEDDIGRIFEAFHRAENSGEIPGSGIGLFLAAECAAAHGGNLNLLASGPEGSIFDFSFPTPMMEYSPFTTSGTGDTP